MNTQKLIMAVIAILLPLFASADDSGMCGDNVTYYYEESTNTLTISGFGKMYDYGFYYPDLSEHWIYYDNADAPWNNYKAEIKHIYISEGVTEIGVNAFEGFSNLLSVTMPKTIKEISFCAFRRCSGLSSITIPSSVKRIEWDVFEGCNSLESVNITDLESWCNISYFYEDGYTGGISNPLKYAHHLFLNGSEIHDLVIPNTIKSIGRFSFLGCAGLTSVTIPNTIECIGDYAFSGCTGLTSVMIPSSVKTIRDGAFSGCTSLTSFDMPNTVESINHKVFYGCTGLSSFFIPSSVTVIESQSFANCSGLTSITIPGNVTSVGSSAFAGCNNLTSVTIQKEIASFGSNAFSGCNINTLNIELETITASSINVFTDNRVTDVIISNNTKTIEESAFSALSKTILNIIIGNSVESIKTRAFANLDNLETVKCKATTVPNTHRTAFENSYTADYVDLYVPQEAVEAYRTTAPWKDFKSINGMAFQKYTLTYLVDHEPLETNQFEENDPITPEPAPTRDGYTFSGWSEIPSTMPANDVTVKGTFTKLKCATPTIALTSGKLVFSCDTPDVLYHYSITSSGAASGIGNEILLSSIYTVTVYATRENYDDSDPTILELQVKHGDLNGDGRISVTDAVSIVNRILENNGAK